MPFDVSAQLRFAVDQAGAVPCIMGLRPYQVNLITITNDQVGFNDVSTGRVVTVDRILIADGYRNLPGLIGGAFDGYLNPSVNQVDGQQLMVSNGQITHNIIKVRFIAFPYTVPFATPVSGGLNPSIFQPSRGQIYIQILGPTLSPEGNFFEVTEVVSGPMMNISYDLVLTATTQNPLL